MAVAVARLMLLLLLAAAAACLAAAETVSAPFTGEEREDYMLRLREKGGGSVLSLSDKTYPALAASGPRPYHLAVLLVAMADQYKCTMCAKALEEFKLAAENYRVHYEDQGKRSKDGGEEEPRVFFVVLDFPRSTETFRSLKVNQAPTAFHIPPKLSFAVDDYDVQPQAMMGIMKKSGWTAEDFALFVNMKAGTDFEIVRSQLVAMISLSLLVITVLASIKPLVRRRDQVMQVVRYKWLWFVISLSIYTFSISGGVYDMIRGPALFQEDPRTGEVSLFHPQNNAQYVVEGFLVGLTMLCAACSVLCLIVVAPKFKSQLARDVVAGGCCAAFFVLFVTVLRWYTMKNRWYAFKFFSGA